MRFMSPRWMLSVSFAGSLLMAAKPAVAQVTCSCGFSGSMHLHHVTNTPLTARTSDELLTDTTPISNNLGSFDIQINPRSSLAGNSAALAAFGRAASRWEGFISDPITVIIDADVGPNTPDNSPFPTGVIGVTNQSLFSANFDGVRGTLVTDATNESANGIVASLPTSVQFNANLPQPAGRPRSLSGSIGFTAANAKALNITLPKGPTAPDATIFFNSNFSFDYDSSDGVAPGTTDFETVATHELGHALGFISFVDQIAGSSTTNGETSVTPTTMDLFRFPSNAEPDTASDFTNLPRELRPGVNALFDDIVNEYGLSTGLNTLEFPAGSGTDNRQASHWKDDAFTGTLIGVMDPTLAAGQVFPLKSSDLRVLDLIGYEINIPEPATFGLLAVAATLALAQRRRSFPCPVNV